MRQKNIREIFAHYQLRTYLLLIFILFLSILFSSEKFVNAKPYKNQSKNNQNEKEIKTLEPGKTIERQLAGGESHFYQIHLDTGQFLHADVEQKGIDVVVYHYKTR